MEDERDYLQIQLMFREAQNWLYDANILQQRLDRKADSAYLLKLLAFELLLKCLWRIQFGKITRTHGYRELFRKLPDDIQNKLVNLAKQRMSTIADYSDVDTLLGTWSENFIKLRYPYEPYEGLSEQEYVQIGENWIQEGAKTEDATFVYYPNELKGLIFALQQVINEYIEYK